MYCIFGRMFRRKTNKNDIIDPQAWYRYPSICTTNAFQQKGRSLRCSRCISKLCLVHKVPAEIYAIFLNLFYFNLNWTYWLIKTLISGTSWTRRNLLMQRLHHKDQQQSQQQLQNNRQKCIEDNDQLVASPWFQEGLSRYVQQLHCLKKSCSLKPMLKKIWVHFKVLRLM